MFIIIVFLSIINTFIFCCLVTVVIRTIVDFNTTIRTRHHLSSFSAGFTSKKNN